MTDRAKNDIKNNIKSGTEPLQTETQAEVPEENKYPDCLIIKHPDLKSMPRILGEGILTVVLWGIWVYLWLPLISLLAWLAGYTFLHHHMIELGGLSGFGEQLGKYSIGVFLVSGALIVWSFYNYKRYGAKHYEQRRKGIRETDVEGLAATINVSPQRLSEIQQAKRVSYAFHEDDSVQEVKLSSSEILGVSGH